MAGQKRLGELLVEMGFIDARMLQSALEEQKRSHRRLGKILVEMSAVTEERLVRALSIQLGIEVCDPIATPVHQRVRSLITPELAHTCRVIPIAIKRDEGGQSIYVATADPLDRSALETLHTHFGANTRIRWMLAGETEIELALARHYGTEPPRSSGHFPPQQVYDAPMTSSPGGGRYVPPVIQGRPVSGPRSSARACSPVVAMQGVPVAMPPHDADADFQVVPLAGVMPQLNVRGRQPSSPRRTESSPPPPTPDLPSPEEIAAAVQQETYMEEPFRAGASHALLEFDPVAAVAAVVDDPPSETVPIEEANLEPIEALEVVDPHENLETIEPIETIEPLETTPAHNNGANGLSSVVIEEPTLEPTPEHGISVKEIRPMMPTLIDRTGQPRIQTGDDSGEPPVPLLGSWGDLVAGSSPGGAASSALAGGSGAAPVVVVDAPMNGISMDLGLEDRGALDIVTETRPLSPDSVGEPSAETLEPDIIEEVDAELLETEPSPSPSQSESPPPMAPATDDVVLRAAKPEPLVSDAPPDDSRWNIALAEAAAEALAEATASLEHIRADTPSPDLSFPIEVETDPTAPISVDPPPRLELPRLNVPRLDAPRFDARPTDPTEHTVPLPIDEDPLPSPTAELRLMLETFAAGVELEPDRTDYVLRAMAAVMLNEGWFDEVRLEKVIGLLGEFKVR